MFDREKMPSYKLMYFNGRGCAEASSYLFALAGVEDEDYMYAEGEWPTVKPSEFLKYKWPIFYRCLSKPL